MSAKGPFPSQIIGAFAEDGLCLASLCYSADLYISLSTGSMVASVVSDQKVRAFNLVHFQDLFGYERCFLVPYKFYDYFSISIKMPLKF